MEGRLRKELQEVQRDPGSGVSVERDEGNLTHFTGVLTGPSDTPYQGFRLKIVNQFSSHVCIQEEYFVLISISQSIYIYNVNVSSYNV